jgi:hypothetical protein
MAKQRKQDRNRQKASTERPKGQTEKDAADARERMDSPADVARKGKKPSFGHN